MSITPKRVYNFNPGPAALPLEVLQEAQAEMAKARTLMKLNSEGKMGELSREPAANSPPNEKR